MKSSQSFATYNRGSASGWALITAYGLWKAVQDRLKQTTLRLPRGMPNDPEDIAALVVFLASPGARNITGQSFNIDGGVILD